VINDNDHLIAKREQMRRKQKALQTRADELVRKCRERVRELEEDIRALDRIMEIDSRPLDDLLLGSSNVDAEASNGDDAARTPIGEAIDKFLTESGASEFTAPQVVAYMRAAGYPVKPASTLNSVRESLRRRIARGQVEKSGVGTYRVRQPELQQ
jgi:hypothetical protein